MFHGALNTENISYTLGLHVGLHVRISVFMYVHILQWALHHNQIYMYARVVVMLNQMWHDICIAIKLLLVGIVVIRTLNNPIPQLSECEPTCMSEIGGGRGTCQLINTLACVLKYWENGVKLGPQSQMKAQYAQQSICSTINHKIVNQSPRKSITVQCKEYGRGRRTINSYSDQFMHIAN